MFSYRSFKLSSFLKILFFTPLLVCLGEFHALCFSLLIHFFLLHSVCHGTLLVYFSVQLPYSSVLWVMFVALLYFLFVEVLIVFIHTTPEFGTWDPEHLYDHYFELLIRLIIYLHIITVSFWEFVLFYHLECISLFPQYAWFFVFSLCVAGKMTNSFSIEGVAFYRWWIFSFTLSLGFGSLLSLWNCLNCFI